jgi:hypothetical protein
MAGNGQSEELAAFYGTLPDDIREEATQKCERARMAYRVSRDAIVAAHDALAVPGCRGKFAEWCRLAGLNPNSMKVQVSRWKKELAAEKVNNANHSEDGDDGGDDDPDDEDEDDQPPPPDPKPRKGKKPKQWRLTFTFTDEEDFKEADARLGRLMETRKLDSREQVLLALLRSAEEWKQSA